MTSQTMEKSQKPYLVRAIFQWIIDNDCTPHLIVAAPSAGWVTGLDDSYLQDEFLVLNISPTAAPDCVIEDDYIFFSARFKGKVCQVGVAMEAVAAMVARETGQGFNFDLPENLADGPQCPPNKPISKEQSKDSSSKKTMKSSKSHLKIIR